MTMPFDWWKYVPPEFRSELSENLLRKDFTPIELDKASRFIEPFIAKAAEERQRQGGRTKAGGKLPPAEKFKTRDVVARLLGTSGRKLKMIQDVVDAAAADPERFGPLLDEMNRRGTAHNAYRTLQIVRDQERVAQLRPIAGRFRTVLLDPPLKYDDDVAGQTRPNYATMTREELLALPVRNWADENCHCYLWVTNAMLLFGFELLAAYGFDYKTMLTWLKPHSGLGIYFRNQTEHVLFGVKGRLPTRANLSNIFEGPVGVHSEKPEQFYELVRRASYPPYGEAFQRTPRADFVNLYQPLGRPNRAAGE
jgi:N6-adenosine-specific RNA methylase IME4